MTLYVEIETVPIEVPEGTDAESIKKLSLSACTARVYAIDDREAEAHQKNETISVYEARRLWTVTRKSQIDS